MIVKLREISGTGSQFPVATPDLFTGLEGAGIADQDYRQLAAAGARRFDGFISPIGRIQTHQRRCRAGASHCNVGADQ
ncbi:msl8601 [Mesorhizobium japonicum MAFF 303099]|uniref:Msl8601 protein n=1 Tax=Mesorhizobium japonicum (strain LMG 29417 / CECT 9101 / MAFF 303099) TaxID=266835 RepID=Q98L16_RHILO|nr:msl8601 [Mesorhizobium japonicum MAFF 303099]